MLIFFIRITWQMIRNRFELLFQVNNDFWYLGFIPEKKIKPKGKKFKKIKSSKGKFWADPFLYLHNNKTYLFFENFSLKQNKGDISCAEIDSKGIKKPIINVLSKKYHVSYPYVFKFKKAQYLLPESSSDRSISIYKATNFPEKWKLSKTIIRNVNAVDSSIIKYKNLWYLFTSINEYESTSADELFLFYSKSLFGEWMAHPLNPIISDARSARSAGKFILIETVFTDQVRIVRRLMDQEFV